MSTIFRKRQRHLLILFILTTWFSFGQKATIQCVSSPDTLYGQQVYDFPTKFPKFGNKPHDFAKYMRKNLIYKQDPDNPIYTIRYTFVVDTTGALKNVCVFNNADNLNYNKLQTTLDSTLSKCPKWTPGLLRGKKVNTRMASVIHLKFTH